MLTRPQVCWTADIAKVFDNRAPTRRMARYGIDLGWTAIPRLTG
jgi:hypothetical protein